VDDELQREFMLCLTRPLDDVVGALDIPASRAPRTADRWSLPPADRQALQRWGVPVDETRAGRAAVRLAGAVQAGDAPEVNDDDTVAYLLGTYWRRRLGAVVGSGRVVGVAADAPRRVSPVNSSVAAFVDVAWRWAAARRVLAAIEEHGDYRQYYDDLAMFRDHVHAVDAAVRDDPAYEWWDGILNG
jgi:hypothetical protein